jgi:hypothetical protein
MQVKSMITPSAARTVWKQRYTPQNKHLDDNVIQRQMNNHVQCGTNQKDEYPESKTVSRINLITSEQSKILIV